MTTFQELSGVFEMRIYDGEHTVGQILEDCKVETRGDDPPPGIVHGVDLAKLNRRLSTINVPEIRQRRARLNIFSQEVLVSADPDRGISFLSVLLILAHYNVISDGKALRLEEFLRRRYRLQRVEEEVRRRIVIGFFDTLYWSRQFRRRQELRNSARMVTIPQFAVPEILVDDQDGPTPLVDTFQDPSGPSSPLPTSPDRSGPSLGLGLDPLSPANPTSPSRNRGNSFGSSPSRSERSFDRSPTMRARRPSDMSDIDPLTILDGMGECSSERHGSSAGGSPARSRAVSTTGTSGFEASGTGAAAARHRRQQSSQGSQHLTAMAAFDNSAWGESIRRSFTLRRNTTRGRVARLGSSG